MKRYLALFLFFNIWSMKVLEVACNIIHILRNVSRLVFLYNTFETPPMRTGLSVISKFQMGR